MKKRRIKTYVILVLVFISIGVVYAALTTSFGISGTVNVSSATYNVTYTGSNATFSSSSSSIIFGSTTTNKITPVTGYYLKSLSCTNGYTTDATTGTSATAAQTVTISNNKNASNSACTATMSNIYNASITGNNTTSSTSNLSIPYNSSSTIEVTPKTGYYFITASCTNGYTIEGLVAGKGNTSTQTLTINNNANAKDSVCTISAIDAYSISITGSHATYAAPQGGTIGYGGSKPFTLTPSTGYYVSGISCTNGYTATGNMGPTTEGASIQTITINNNKNAADTKCTVTMSNVYQILFLGSNVTYSSTNLAVTYGYSRTVTVTPAEGFYLKSFTCTNGYTTNATTGESATGSQSITISNNNNTSSASCTAVAEMPINTQWIYKYDKDNKGVKQFEVPMTGRYKLEVISGVGGRPAQRQWVAATTDNYQCAVKQTATSELGAAYFPGKVEAEFNFTQGQTLYVVPGGNGGTGYSATSDATAAGCGSATKGSGGYNGGLAGTANAMSGSGGVTHIALVDGLYSDISSSSDLLISAKSGGRYSYPKSKVSDGVGSNYVNTSSSNYVGGMATTEKYTTSDYYGTAIITYLGP